MTKHELLAYIKTAHLEQLEFTALANVSGKTVATIKRHFSGAITDRIQVIQAGQLQMAKLRDDGSIVKVKTVEQQIEQLTEAVSNLTRLVDLLLTKAEIVLIDCKLVKGLMLEKTNWNCGNRPDALTRWSHGTMILLENGRTANLSAEAKLPIRKAPWGTNIFGEGGSEVYPKMVVATRPMTADDQEKFNGAEG